MWQAASPHLPPVSPSVYTYRMKRMTLIGAVALGVTLVWACSSAVEDLVRTPDASAGDSVSTSGERLQIRPIVYEGDDGSVIRMGEEIFDTELGVVCEPMLAADGVVRCLPREDSFFHLPSLFADPNCTKLTVARMSGCDDVPAFATIGSAAECPSGDRSGQVYRLMEKSQGFLKTGDSCLPYTGENGDIDVFLAEPLDFASFVELHR